MVVKECYGSLGGQVYLARNWDGTARAGGENGGAALYCAGIRRLQRGTGYSPIYGGGAVDRRHEALFGHRFPGEYRWRRKGGGVYPHGGGDSSGGAVLLFAEAGFRRVDLLHGEDGRPLVCEVNSNAHMAALTACSGVDVAGAILEHVLGREAERG